MSQAKKRFPHHKMLNYMKFDFLSTCGLSLLKGGRVDKCSKLLFNKHLRRSHNGDKIAKLLRCLQLRHGLQSVKNRSF